MCKSLEMGKTFVVAGIEMRLTRVDNVENAFVSILFLQLCLVHSSSSVFV